MPLLSKARGPPRFWDETIRNKGSAIRATPCAAVGARVRRAAGSRRPASGSRRPFRLGGKFGFRLGAQPSASRRRSARSQQKQSSRRIRGEHNEQGRDICIIRLRHTNATTLLRLMRRARIASPAWQRLRSSSNAAGSHTLAGLSAAFQQIVSMSGACPEPARGGTGSSS